MKVTIGKNAFNILIGAVAFGMWQRSAMAGVAFGVFLAILDSFTPTAN